MALVNLPGKFLVPIGPDPTLTQGVISPANSLVDAVNEAVIYIGHITTSDGNSHTIDATGSSAFGWRSGACTFANGSTIVKVGLAAVDAAAGPPGRAVNVGNVITFDVSKSMTGGGGGITANSWQTHAPDTGSKTIANGDFIAFAVQMTARGGTDLVNVSAGIPAGIHHRPLVTTFTAVYFAEAQLPNIIITFSDGALGFFAGTDVFNRVNTWTFDNTLATKEYGQLFQLPFPTTIYGVFGWLDPDGDCDLVLYSDPLGSPVAQRTCALDLNIASAATVRRFVAQFSSPYSTTGNQIIAIAFKPGATGVTIYTKILANAAHRISDAWGTTGYGVVRDTGAFSNINSSLEHCYIGLLVGAFDAGGGGRTVQINNDSVVA